MAYTVDTSKNTFPKWLKLYKKMIEFCAKMVEFLRKLSKLHPITTDNGLAFRSYILLLVKHPENLGVIKKNSWK